MLPFPASEVQVPAAAVAAAVGAVVQVLAAASVAVVARAGQAQVAARVAGQQVGTGRLARVLPQLLAALPPLPALLEAFLREHWRPCCRP